MIWYDFSNDNTYVEQYGIGLGLLGCVGMSGLSGGGAGLTIITVQQHINAIKV